ncbi:MAG: hypothetical protein IH819_01785 [Bacteroidetes bacterium]|nr:hypothetical protein [Bacteroidota bacterium]
MNKKAFLLAEETLKIVIAVISISFLVYFLSSLYFANQSSKELELAEATLERIGDIIKGLSEGKSELQDVSNPQGWYLFSFTENNEKPNTCIGKNCLCICDEVLIDDFFERLSDLENDTTSCNKAAHSTSLVLAFSFFSNFSKIGDHPTFSTLASAITFLYVNSNAHFKISLHIAFSDSSSDQ